MDFHWRAQLINIMWNTLWNYSNHFTAITIKIILQIAHFSRSQLWPTIAWQIILFRIWGEDIISGSSFCQSWFFGLHGDLVPFFFFLYTITQGTHWVTICIVSSSFIVWFCAPLLVVGIQFCKISGVFVFLHSGFAPLLLLFVACSDEFLVENVIYFIFITINYAMQYSAERILAKNFL